jgi:hypothetical protein
LDHELRELDELHEYTLLSVIPAKAGIHFMTTSYPNVFKKITTEIQEINSEQHSGEQPQPKQFSLRGAKRRSNLCIMLRLLRFARNDCVPEIATEIQAFERE